MSNQDTEFTLTPGKILFIFFGFTAVCGAFFGIGYSMGRNSTPLSVNLSNNPPALPSTTTTADKPQPGVPSAVVQSPCQGDNCPATAAEATGNTAATATAANAAPAAPAAIADNQPETAKANQADTPPATAANKAPESISAKQTGFMVQVAAVTRQEDAEVLVNALRKKSYPVFIANLPSDKLLHVQVGPFTEKTEAEAMRSRLSDDGYNAILKTP